MDSLTYQWFVYLDKRIENIRQTLHAEAETLAVIGQAVAVDNPAIAAQVAKMRAKSDELRKALDAVMQPPEKSDGAVGPPPMK